MTETRCTATTKEGKPCRMRPLAGSSLCWNHASGIECKRVDGRQAGGEARGRQQQRAAAAPMIDAGPAWTALATRGDVADALRDVTRRSMDGSLSMREAQVAVQALKQLGPMVEADERARSASAAATTRARRLKKIPSSTAERYAWGARALLLAIEEVLTSPTHSPEKAIEQLGRLSIPLGHLLKTTELDEELKAIYAAVIEDSDHPRVVELAQAAVERRAGLDDDEETRS